MRRRNGVSAEERLACTMKGGSGPSMTECVGGGDTGEEMSQRGLEGTLGLQISSERKRKAKEEPGEGIM